MHQPDLTDLSVIIVDDQRDFLRLFSAIIRSFGVRKLTNCQKAEEATQRMHAYQFDMMFTDMRMPEISGIDLIKRIRSDEKLLCRGLPIICVSAFSEQSAIQSAIRAGADDFLVKPVRPIDVYRRLSAHLINPLPRIKVPGYFGPDPKRSMGADSRRANGPPPTLPISGPPPGYRGDPEAQSDSDSVAQAVLGADNERILLGTDKDDMRHDVDAGRAQPNAA